MTAEGYSAAVSPPSPAASAAPLAGARHALLLLLLINLFNFIDRQVLAAVETPIREEFFRSNPNDPKTETANAKELMGYLSFAFLVTYMLTAPIFGALATRMSRWLLIAIGVIVWTLASGASGLAPYLAGQLGGGGSLLLFGCALPTAYLVMLLTRCFVGVGEGVYGPIAPDVISDLFPPARRGQILAWFYAAIPVGGALGYALGSEVVRLTGQWRYAFYLVVPPGLLLGAWCLLMREPPRGSADHVAAVPRSNAWSDYLILLRTPSYLLNTAGMTFMCFAMGGLAFWAPGYLKHLEVQPVLGMAPGTFFGLLTASMGLLATIAGGLAGDALRRRFSGSYFLVSGAAMCVGFPMLLLMVALPFPLAWVPLAAFVFCLFFNTGPTNTIIANVTHPLLRARGFALNILLIHLLGDALSPSVMGKIIGKEDRYDLAFQLVSVTVLLGGLLWLWGARHLQRDTDRAHQPLPAR